MDKLTLPRLEALHKNWQKNGSLYINTTRIMKFMETYLGVDTKSKEEKQKESGSFEELVSLFGAMGGSVG